MMIIQEEGLHLFFDVLLDSILKEEITIILQDRCLFQYNLFEIEDVNNVLIINNHFHFQEYIKTIEIIVEYFIPSKEKNKKKS